MLAYYVHNLSPFVVRFSENWGIRWYGLAYVGGFFAAFLVMRFMIRRNYCTDLKEEQLTDFVTWSAILGVMVGGRLGYMLLYDREQFFANPLIFFRFLDGGMASHGGIAGLVIFSWFYARKHKVSWTGIGDQLCIAAPLGIFFGRMANFINGELYGRATQVAWAMQFPEELRERNFPHYEEAAARCAEFVPGDVVNPDTLIEASRSSPEVREILGELLTPRHPSQLYQAFMEGLALFLILFFIKIRWKTLPNGVITGLFFILYAIFRIVGEGFRQPDSGFGPFGILTKGQFFSSFMILIGTAFVVTSVVKSKRARAKAAS